MFSSLYQLQQPRAAKTAHVLQCESHAYQDLIVLETLLRPMLSQVLLENVHEQPVHVHHTLITKKLQSRDSVWQLKFLRQRSEESLIMALIQIRLSLDTHIKVQKTSQLAKALKTSQLAKAQKTSQLAKAQKPSKLAKAQKTSQLVKAQKTSQLVKAQEKQYSNSRRGHKIRNLKLRQQIILQKIMRALLKIPWINRLRARRKNLK